MNGKERITLLMRNVRDGKVSVKTATEIAVQIFGDVYDEGKALVVESLNPPTQTVRVASMARDDKKCYCGACGYGFKRWQEFAEYYDLGGES